MTASSILTTKVNDNLAVCSNSYEYITITDRLTTSTSVSWYTDISDFSSNECLVWTACNGGSISGIYLNSSTTQTFCDYQGSGCHTINLRKQFGDTIGGLTFLNCIATTSGQDTKTIMYQIKPASSMEYILFRLFITFKCAETDLRYYSWPDYDELQYRHTRLKSFRYTEPDVICKPCAI